MDPMHVSCAECLLLALLATALLSRAASLDEDFSEHPESRGWRVAGDPSLFLWNAPDKTLEVTWDSSKPNSFFARPLGTVLGKRDDFSLSFDLKLREVRIGTHAGHPFAFQIAVGLLNLPTATNANFRRGTGTQSPNLVEFNYFPDSGFGATVSPVIVSSNSQFIPAFSFPLELTLEDLFQVRLNYSATNQVLATMMTRNGLPFGPIKDVVLPAAFTDFRVDALAVSSYSDEGSGGSIFARGVLDNVSVVWPNPPITALRWSIEDGGWVVNFDTAPGWSYTLERTADLLSWKPISAPAPGTGTTIILRDGEGRAGRAFYRVRAERP